MNIVRAISALFICFILITGNVANAAMPCCMTDMDQSNAETQMQQNDMDMPCHETADSKQENSKECSDCDCQQCVKMTALPLQTATQGEASSSPQTFGTPLVHSRQPESIFQPPKNIS